MLRPPVRPEHAVVEGAVLREIVRWVAVVRGVRGVVVAEKPHVVPHVVRNGEGRVKHNEHPQRKGVRAKSNADAKREPRAENAGEVFCGVHASRVRIPPIRLNAPVVIFVDVLVHSRVVKRPVQRRECAVQCADHETDGAENGIETHGTFRTQRQREKVLQQAPFHEGINREVRRTPKVCAYMVPSRPRPPSERCCRWQWPARGPSHLSATPRTPHTMSTQCTRADSPRTFLFFEICIFGDFDSH